MNFHKFLHWTLTVANFLGFLAIAALFLPQGMRSVKIASPRTMDQPDLLAFLDIHHQRFDLEFETEKYCRIVVEESTPSDGGKPRTSSLVLPAKTKHAYFRFIEGGNIEAERNGSSVKLYWSLTGDDGRRVEAYHFLPPGLARHEFKRNHASTLDFAVKYRQSSPDHPDGPREFRFYLNLNDKPFEQR